RGHGCGVPAPRERRREARLELADVPRAGDQEREVAARKILVEVRERGVGGAGGETAPEEVEVELECAPTSGALEVTVAIAVAEQGRALLQGEDDRALPFPERQQHRVVPRAGARRDSLHRLAPAAPRARHLPVTRFGEEIAPVEDETRVDVPRD